MKFLWRLIVGVAAVMFLTVFIGMGSCAVCVQVDGQMHAVQLGMKPFNSACGEPR